MTVKELIEELEKYDENLEVVDNDMGTVIGVALVTFLSGRTVLRIV